MNTTKRVKTIFIYYYKISLQWISTNYNREERSLRHVVLVAKFLDDNKPKIHQKENLHRFKLHRSYLISVIKFVKVGDIFLVESERTVSKLRKKKTKIFGWFTDSMKRALEIRKFHVAVVQPRQRNEKNSMIHVQICCFVDKNLLLFTLSPQHIST